MRRRRIVDLIPILVVDEVEADPMRFVVKGALSTVEGVFSSKGQMQACQYLKCFKISMDAFNH